MCFLAQSCWLICCTHKIPRYWVVRWAKITNRDGFSNLFTLIISSRHLGYQIQTFELDNKERDRGLARCHRNLAYLGSSAGHDGLPLWIWAPTSTLASKTLKMKWVPPNCLEPTKRTRYWEAAIRRFQDKAIDTTCTIRNFTFSLARKNSLEINA